MRSEVADDLRRVGVGERRAVEMGLRHYRARLPRLIGVVGQRNTACPIACTARRVEEVSSEDGVRLKRVSCKRGRQFSKLSLVGITTDHSLSLFSDKERGVRRQNAFEHLIRIFRFLVIQFRCGKRQDTISDKRGIHNTRLTRHNRCG